MLFSDTLYSDDGQMGFFDEFRRRLSGGGSSESPVHRLIVQLGLALGFTTFVAIFLHFLKQSTIVSYILVGVILRRIFDELDVTPDTSTLDHFSHVGIILLLFMAGLEVDIPAFISRWRLVCTVGIGQIIVTSIFGMAVGTVLVPSMLNGIFGLVYFGFCCTFSSTIVVLGMLNRHQQLESLHGQICLGLLVLQDITAVTALAILSAATTEGTWAKCTDADWEPENINGTTVAPLSSGIGSSGGLRRLSGGDSGSGSEQSLGMSLVLLVVWLVVFSVAQFLSSRYLLLPLFRVLTSTGELLFLGTIGYALLSAGLADAVNFSAEIGAFLAGVSMTMLPYKLEIEDKVENLKNFGIVTFFITLGLEMDLNISASDYMAAFVLGTAVVFGTMGIVIGLGYVARLKARPTFMIGGIVNQISEFSLILASLCVQRGIFCPAVLTILTVACVITIVVSGIGHEILEPMWKFFSPRLSFLDKRSTMCIVDTGHKLKDHVVIFGVNKLTHLMAKYAERVLKKDFMIAVSINADHVDGLRDHPFIQVLFADMFDPDTWAHARIEDAALVISAIEGGQEAEVAMARYMRENGGKAFYITTTDSDEEALELYQTGSDFVIHTADLAAQMMQDLLQVGDLTLLRDMGIVCRAKLEKEHGLNHPMFKHGGNKINQFRIRLGGLSAGRSDDITGKKGYHSYGRRRSAFTVDEPSMRAMFEDTDFNQKEASLEKKDSGRMEAVAESETEEEMAQTIESQMAREMHHLTRLYSQDLRSIDLYNSGGVIGGCSATATDASLLIGRGNEMTCGESSKHESSAAAAAAEATEGGTGIVRGPSSRSSIPRSTSKSAWATVEPDETAAIDDSAVVAFSASPEETADNIFGP